MSEPRKPYRKGNPNGFRKVHHALARTHTLGHSIVLSFPCNVAPGENTYAVERRWIREYNTKGSAPWQLNGGRG